MSRAGELKVRVCAEVDTWAEELVRISRAIHAHPEIGHQEVFAHDLLTDVLERAGLAPERSAYGLGTAFAARAGNDGPTVAVLCEYDALRDIGHACGHNVIAAAGLGAALAAATVVDEANGSLLVLGTPCEEAAPQGKITLAERGAFAGVDAAVMVHPADADLCEMDTLASIGLVVTYTGRTAHAAAAPQHGRNALDAAVLGYNAVAALRQHIAPDERIHCVFTEVPQRVNVVPDRVVAQWSLRSATLARAQQLEPRVLACLESWALAAGCEIHVTNLGVTEEVRTNRALTASYVANMATLGRTVGDPTGGGGTVGSTDMGHVSYRMPVIHPLIAVAPPGVKIHEVEFASAAASAAADQAVIDGAKAMAMTMVDYWTDPSVRVRARSEFESTSAGRTDY